MIKNFFLILFFILLANCSFYKAGFWTEQKSIKSLEESNTEISLFEIEALDENEFNPQLIIKIKGKEKNSTSFNGNNIGLSQIDLDINNISKFKFKKIEYFNQFEPELVFYKNDLIFFDKEGTILRFKDNLELVWKKNYYSKREKKQKPLIKLYSYEDKLLVIDNLYNFYLIDIDSGNLLWKKDHITSFISQIKISNNKFYVLDGTNKLICFSLDTGEKIWDFRSDERIINSAKENSILLNETKVIFNNSKGDIIALDKNNGSLVWINPTISYNEAFQSYLIDYSELVLDGNSVYFSNTNNKFFSLDEKTGTINWQQNINSTLRPIIVDELIISISRNGYLYFIEKYSGNIIRITDTFRKIKKRKRKKTIINGFIADQYKIYASTKNGKLIFINISDGNIENVYKVARGEISKPHVNNRDLYIIKNDQILRFN